MTEASEPQSMNRANLVMDTGIRSSYRMHVPNHWQGGILLPVEKLASLQTVTDPAFFFNVFGIKYQLIIDSH